MLLPNQIWMTLGNENKNLKDLILESTSAYCNFGFPLKILKLGLSEKHGRTR